MLSRLISVPVKNPIRLTMLIFIGLLLMPFCSAHADDHHSVARAWNEVLLHSIRNDLARPTVHARNLFHASAAMYDVWAVYHPPATPYFLGQTLANDVRCDFTEEQRNNLIAAADSDEVRTQHIELALSAAVQQLLLHRFADSPGAARTRIQINSVLDELGYDFGDDTQTEPGTPRALGNTLAQCVIEYGTKDGANESALYTNEYYTPVNAALNPEISGNASLMDPDRWQPLLLSNFVDQSGNPLDMPEFLGAEWGNVTPFALAEQDSVVYRRNGDEYRVYLDPGAPALHADDSANYAWGHSMVAVWSSQLDPTDGVLWDISPATIGASDSLPNTIAGLADFYQYEDGGVQQLGHAQNPVTGEPYAPNAARRGDYARVIAEYWADGPDSETPPGHWFTIFNDYVLDHPDFERRFMGEGEVLSDLEFDIRGYFLLGATMHDAAIAAWSVKGWYDYIRPVSALRYLANLGQSTDATQPNYNPDGIPLLEGTIEVIQAGDLLAGANGEHTGKIKVHAWRGPSYIANPGTDIAGVGWIRLEDWWPYQRSTFVTPPFAGYVSGHSTFSRAAAEVLTTLTGSEFFPGGIAEFVAEQEEFLVFEDGPSQDVTLQWATFRDASDQSSLSRIWGGIHPPVDDVPGRKLGIQVAERTVARVNAYLSGGVISSLNDASVENGSESRSGSGCSVQRSTNSGFDPFLLIFILLSCLALLRKKDSPLPDLSVSKSHR